MKTNRTIASIAGLAFSLVGALSVLAPSPASADSPWDSSGHRMGNCTVSDIASIAAQPTADAIAAGAGNIASCTGPSDSPWD